MMKKNLRFVFYFFLIIFLFGYKSFGTTWTVTVSDFSFNPQNLSNVFVGDTVKWQWLNGSHTTTSLEIPDAAFGWDSPMNNLNQVFTYVVMVPGSYSYKCIPHFPMMLGSFTVNAIVVGMAQLGGQIPAAFKLNQNYPNPFNPITKVKFEIAEMRFVQLKIYNVLGREIAAIVNEQLNPGIYEVNWDASNYPSGVYYYRLISGDYIETLKMILVK